MVSLVEATAANAALLGELLELYVQELSAVFTDVVPGPDGRFSYPRLPLYWSEPDRRFAFVIRSNGQVAGFALATRGSPAAEDPDVFDVAEFFVLREYRRSGVGRLAALLLWERFPGTWTVRVAEANRNGLAFWDDVIGETMGERVTISSHERERMRWRIYTFDSVAPSIAM
jgi:predicted acetyltransferase